MFDEFKKILIYIVDKVNSKLQRKSFALNSLDLKLQPFISKKNGFFIEVGANDGVRQSNTLYFERYEGWSGLLIEPIPDLAFRCRENRPNAIIENCALVSFEYKYNSIDMQYCNLMSFVKGGWDNEAVEASHLERGKKFLKQGEESYKISVPAYPLSEIIDKYNISEIDLFSLDVEGYELEVLKGLDFNRHRPKYMLIEVRSGQEKKINELINPWYDQYAKLTINPLYQDILYKLKL